MNRRRFFKTIVGALTIPFLPKVKSEEPLTFQGQKLVYDEKLSTDMDLGENTMSEYCCFTLYGKDLWLKVYTRVLKLKDCTLYAARVIMPKKTTTYYSQKSKKDAVEKLVSHILWTQSSI